MGNKHNKNKKNNNKKGKNDENEDIILDFNEDIYLTPLTDYKYFNRRVP